MDTVLLIPLWWLLEKQFQSVNQRGSKNLGRALPWALAGRTSWVCEQFVWFSFVPSRPGRAELDSWDLISLEEGFEKTWILLILERGKSQGADLHHSPPRKICLPLQVLGKQIGEMCCFDEKPGVKIRNKYWKNNIYKVQRTRKRRTRLMCERKKVQTWMEKKSLKIKRWQNKRRDAAERWCWRKHKLRKQWSERHEFMKSFVRISELERENSRGAACWRGVDIACRQDRRQVLPSTQSRDRLTLGWLHSSAETLFIRMRWCFTQQVG